MKYEKVEEDQKQMQEEDQEEEKEEEEEEEEGERQNVRSSLGGSLLIAASHATYDSASGSQNHKNQPSQPSIITNYLQNFDHCHYKPS